MTLMKSAILVAVMLATLSPLCADSRRDGNWWRQLSRPEKVMYLTGLFDGTDLGNRLSYWSFVEKGEKEKTETATAVIDSYGRMSAKYLKAVTAGQLCDGLTAFYEDYRNRSIVAPNAAWIVLNTIAGKSGKEIESMTESFRKFPDQ